MTHDAVSVLFVGDWARSEFAAVFQWLRDHCRLAAAADISSAVEQLAAADRDSELIPELIVVAQSWPGEFSPKQIERMRRIAPLARICELLGSWCEGESRTGRPPGGTIRNYWHQWLPRMAAQFDRAGSGRRAVWSLPATATDDERLLSLVDEASALPKAQAPRGLIAVLLSSGVMARTLCDACPPRGYASVWLPHGRGTYLSGVRAAIWHAPAVVKSWKNELAAVRREWTDVPIIALVSFPRIEDIEHLRAAGAAAVVSKPFLLGDLFWQIERV